MGGGLGRVTHHPEYYLSDGSVSFLTGTTLFRVHRSYFERESEVFRDLFANAAQDDPPSGTDARPFTLDVKADEFAQLVWVWYDREYSYQQQTKENWVTILRLATRWKFEKIRELAVRELEAQELPPAERISIYNEHSIDGERVVSSFVELCKSPTVPTEADARLLQMESLIKLLQAREDAQRKAVELGHNSPTSASLEDEALREIVSKLLRKGLDPCSGGPSTGSGDQAPDPKAEHHHGTTADIPTLKTPQVPERKANPASGPSSQPNNSLQTGSGAKGSRGKEQAQQAESSNMDEKVKKEEGSVEGKLAKATQDREKEEKARQAREKEEKAKAEKAKQDKEKEAKAKEQNAGQRSRGNPSSKTWGN